MTEELFREDAYLATAEARIVALDDGAVELDKTIFYAAGGGQPGDQGRLIAADGRAVAVTDTIKDRETGRLLHLVADTGGLKVGDGLRLELDWARRHRLMRMHSCLHLLCSLVDAPVTGGQVSEDKGRLDFDLDETPDKEALEAELNRLVAAQIPVSANWITDAELDANPDLVRTMSVQPPRGTGRVRTINIDGVDLQPCGGTHVRNTSEIGPVRIGKIEKKGKMNRRINIHFAD